MEEKKHVSDQYPGLVHFRKSTEVGKPLCNSAQINPKFSEDGREVTCRSCQKRSKRP